MGPSALWAFPTVNYWKRKVNVNTEKSRRKTRGKTRRMNGTHCLLAKLTLWFLEVWIVVWTILSQSTESPFSIMVGAVVCCSSLINISFCLLVTSRTDRQPWVSPPSHVLQNMHNHSLSVTTWLTWAQHWLPISQSDRVTKFEIANVFLCYPCHCSLDFPSSCLNVRPDLRGMSSSQAHGNRVF